VDFGGRLDEDIGHLGGAGADLGHPVDNQAGGDGVNEVEDVVELGGELVDVLAVEGRDEGLVELGDDFVGELVAAMLDFFDAPGLRVNVLVVVEEVGQCPRALLDVLGHLREHGEEGMVAGYETR